MNRPPFQSFGTTIMSCAPLIATRSTVFCAAADPDSSANATTAAARRALMRWVSSRCTPLAARQGRVVVVRGRVSVVVVSGTVTVVVVRGRVSVVVVSGTVTVGGGGGGGDGGGVAATAGEEGG